MPPAACALWLAQIKSSKSSQDLYHRPWLDAAGKGWRPPAHHRPSTCGVVVRPPLSIECPRCDPQHLHVAPPRYAHKGVTLLQPLRGGPGPTRRPRGNRRAEARVARLPGQCSCPSDAMHRPTWPEHAPQRRPPRAATHCTAGRGAINPRHQPTEPYHKRQYSSIHELTSATVW
jgi:hypothetical protein